MSKYSIKSASRIFAIAASLAFAGNAMAQASIHVDPNGSCMAWYFVSPSTGQTFTCAGLSQAGTTSRSRCSDVQIPSGRYQFRYGGHQAYDLQIDASSQVSFVGEAPEHNGLLLSSGRIDFQNEVVTLEKNGFPGSLSIEGEDTTGEVDGCWSPNNGKEQFRILKGAKFMVTGEWVESPSGHIHGASKFRLENGQLATKWEGTAAYNGDRVRKTISPNLNYWLKSTPFTSNKAKPVIVVSGEKCPTGFKVWDRAKGRSLLGEGVSFGDKNGDFVRAIIGERKMVDGKYEDLGGEVKHKLSKEEMPGHDHGMKSQIMKKVLLKQGDGINSGVREFNTNHSVLEKKTRIAGGVEDNDWLTEPHNNVPPYIAVNFCELKE